MSLRSTFLVFLVTVLAVPIGPAEAQEAAPARTETASYEIDARLDPATKQIRGTETISYRNPSSDTLSELWFKLYLNAFRSPDTTWMREAGLVHRGSSYDPSRPGWIRLDRMVLESGENLLPAEADAAETILRVALPRALGPGETLRIQVAWTSQLPRVFARTGFAGDFVLAGQWYPKLAVYDRGAWDREPWHANAEFFADFGMYDLAVTIPRGWTTGASGVRVGATDNTDGTTTIRYRAESVSDVAWTAWPDYRAVTRTVTVAGREVELELLTPRELANADERYLGPATATLELLGRWFGAYPWPRLTLVVPPADADGAGGMEYPMFVTLGQPSELPFGLGRGVREPEIVTVHEIAHQWLPLQVATNEAREAWLDEGFADYATIRVLAELYGPSSSMLDVGPLDLGYGTIHRLQLALGAVRQPLVLPAWEYPSVVAYGATVYSKGALGLQSLERTLGEERFLGAMRLFVERWRWRHPTTDDLREALEEGTGERLAWFFEPLAYGRGVAEYRLAEANERSAVVERRGDVRFPVQIQLGYADGRTEVESWDGADEQIELSARGGRLAWVQVDPERRILLELDPFDNARELEPSSSVLAALGRALSLIRAVLLPLGTIG